MTSAYSVAFPHSNDAPNATPLLRPPHLPFRRMSLPTSPNGVFTNRLSLASTTSLESVAVAESSTLTGEIAKPTTPTRNRRRYASSNRRLSKETAAISREMNDKRRKVINEILDTEQAYVDGLDLIYTGFLTPLIESLDTPRPILSRTEITTLFSNFIDIWNLNRSLLTSLTDLLATQDDPPPPLSPILMSHFPYLSLYTPFVTSFPSVLTNLASLTSSRPLFADFIRKQEADPRCGKLTLGDWLLTIVQRCPRYLLLLKDLIGCIDPLDPEHAALVQVHTILSKITQSLNTSLRVHSQTISLLSLQRATVNPPFQFVQPGRVFIRRGSLWQGQAEKSAPSLREFLLFSDHLVWLAHGDERTPDDRLLRPKLQRGRSRSETELLSSATPKRKYAFSTEDKWTCKGYIALLDIEVIITPQSQNNSERARFDVLSPHISFAIYAATEDEREVWVTDIRTAKAALLASLNMMDNNSTLTSSQATTHLRRVLQALPDEKDEDTRKRGRVDHFLPAVWVPDSKTDNCMRCNARFAWRKRRHHCRLCGRCVCADCSTKTFLISDTSTKDTKRARSCNICYETVFPILQDSSESTRENPEEPRSDVVDTTPDQMQPAVDNVIHTDDTDKESTLGTLPKLLNFQSVSDVTAVRRSPSGLLRPGAGLNDLAWNPNSRPLSQPAMNSIDADMASDSFHAAFASERTGRRPSSSSVTRPVAPQLGRQISTAALAITTETITAKPVSPNGGKGKRFSFALSGRRTSKVDNDQEDEDQVAGSSERGPVISRLSEILSRERKQKPK